MADDFDARMAAAPGPRPVSGAVDFDAMLAAAPGPKIPLATSHGEGDQYTGWGRYPAMFGSEMLSGAEGLLDLPRTLGKASAGLINKGTDWALGVSSADRAAMDAQAEKYDYTPGTMLRGATNALGITNNPRLAPQSMAERHLAVSGQAVPAIAGAVLSGGMDLLPAAVSGLAAANASEAVPKDMPLTALGVGIAAGMGGQGLTQSLSGNKLEKVAAALGKSATWQEAGEELQTAARGWLKALPGKLKAAAAPLDKAVPADAPVSLDPILGALKQITAKGGSLGAAIETMSGKLPGKLKDIFSNIKDLNDLAGGANLTAWKDVREFRTFLGNALANPKLAGDLDEAALKQLYKVTTETLGNTAAAHGAADLWSEFNKESTRLHQLQRGPLKKIVSTDNEGRELITPETAGRAMFNSAKKGGSELEDLRLELPKAVDEVGAAALRQGVWDKLSPEGKLQLVTNVKHQRQLRNVAPADVSLKDVLSTPAHAGVGGFFGHQLGGLAASGLGIDQNIGEYTGALIGAGIPYVAKAGGRMLRDPEARAVVPLSGAVGLTVNGLQPAERK